MDRIIPAIPFLLIVAMVLPTEVEFWLHEIRIWKESK